MRLCVFALALVTAMLAGCGSSEEQPPEPAQDHAAPEAPPPPPDVMVEVTHVTEGQRWRYDVDFDGEQQTHVYEVVAVRPGRVVCKKTVVRADGTETDEGLKQFTRSTAALKAAYPGAFSAVRTERVTAAEREWDCYTYEAGGYKIWGTLQGGAPTFPPFVRAQSEGGRAMMVLAAIE